MTAVDPPITYAEMRSLANSSAFGIDVRQDHLIVIGLRKTPDRGQMRNKAIYEATAELVDIITADTVILERINQARIRRKAIADKEATINRRAEVSSGVARDPG